MSVVTETPPIILVVDDAPESLKMFNFCLRKAGFRIAVAQSGEGALQRAVQILPDLIMLDVIMPGLDGFATCRQLKADTRTCDIPVIFVTARHETVDKIKGFEVGGVDYLTKSVQPAEVVARVNTHLMIRRLQRELQLQNAQLQEKNVQLVQERTAELMGINEELRREIEEHRQAERALRESEERYRALYEEAPNAYFSLGADLRITQCNPAAEQFLGYTCTELRQMTLFDLFAEVPEGSSRAEEVFQRVLSGTPVRDQELRMQKKDQTLVWISLRMSLMKDGQDQGMEYRALVVDITERKRQELAIKAERNHFHQENIALRATLQDRYKFGAIIGKSAAMQTVYASIVKAAASDANVVLCGESGTGKELVARTIHQLSKREAQAFVAVNCGAIPETLF